MTTRKLAMPEYIAQLIRLSLARMNLQPIEADNDTISCSLTYEDGTNLSLIVVCMAERGWFGREKPLLLLSIAALDENMRAVRIYSRDRLAIPRSPHDLPFMARLSAKVRANAWTIAATSNKGECVSLPRLLQI